MPYDILMAWTFQISYRTFLFYALRNSIAGNACPPCGVGGMAAWLLAVQTEMCPRVTWGSCSSSGSDSGGLEHTWDSTFLLMCFLSITCLTPRLDTVFLTCSLVGWPPVAHTLTNTQVWWKELQARSQKLASIFWPWILGDIFKPLNFSYLL